MSGLAHKAAGAAQEMRAAVGHALAVPGQRPEPMLEGAL